MPTTSTNHVRSSSENYSKKSLLDMPIDLTTSVSEIPSTDKTEKATNMEEKLRQISDKIKKSLPAKRNPPSIISCNMDPTVRKRHHDPHPMNCINTKSMKKQRTHDEMTNKTPSTTEENPCETTTSDEETTNKTTNEPLENDLDNIINCDLIVSDSDSELEEGESKSDCSDDTVTLDHISDNTNSPTDNNTKVTPCNDLSTGMKKPKSVVINTDANTILEYVPENISRRERKYPEYNPTRKSEEYKVPSVPTHQVLYDLWKIVRNCDQYIGDAMEKAMLHAGYLKPRY